MICWIGAEPTEDCFYCDEPLGELAPEDRVGVVVFSAVDGSSRVEYAHKGCSDEWDGEAVDD